MLALLACSYAFSSGKMYCYDCALGDAACCAKYPGPDGKACTMFKQDEGKPDICFTAAEAKTALKLGLHEA